MRPVGEIACLAVACILAGCGRPNVAIEGKTAALAKNSNLLPEHHDPKQSKAQKGQLGLSADEVHELTKDWDKIGTYSLQENDTIFKVTLFVEDSDSIAERRKPGVRIYPNSFSLHAVWQKGDNPPRHVLLYDRGRVKFKDVADVNAKFVKLQTVSHLKLRVDENGKLPFDDAKIAEMSAPHEMKLYVKYGVPVLE